MTLKEVVESGRSFRRPGMKWYGMMNKDSICNIPVIDAIAEDWELESIPEKTVTITKNDLINVMTRSYIGLDDFTMHKILYTLGLED